MVRRILFAVLFVSTIAFSVCVKDALFAHAESSRKGEDLAALEESYASLFRSDPEVRDLARWEGLASRLLSYVESASPSAKAGRVLFELGELYRHTFEKRHYRTGLTKAVFYYDRLARDFKGNDYVDDALLKLGDLKRNSLADEVGARAAYFEIIDVYPKSNSADAAKERLGLVKVKRAKHAVRSPRSEKSKSRDDGKKTADNGKRDGLKASPKPPAAEEGKSDGSASREKGTSKSTKKRKKRHATADGGKHGTKVRSGKVHRMAQAGKTGKSDSGREIYSSETPHDRPRIVIDPGHGGDEVGASGVVKGVYEKDIVLNIAFYLDELLRQRLRAHTILTRARDVSLPLDRRITIANENRADLFISIHTNATDYHTVSGIETYYLDNTNDESSLRLAERENISLNHKIGDVDMIVSDLIQNVKIDESIALAHYVQNNLSRTLSRYYKPINDLGVKKAPFLVLVGAHMPCILVEVSFIDHPVEGKRLVSKRYQRLVAEGLFLGVREFFERE